MSTAQVLAIDARSALVDARLRAFAALLLAALLLVVAPACVAIEIPTLTARVTDTTGTLTSAERERLEAKLAAFEQRKGSQIVVLMLDSLGTDTTIEEFAVETFERNAVGRKGVDDGVLLVAAMRDRKARIEVGYGLEGAITDLAANRVLQEYLAPHFREGRHAEGIEASVDALIGLADGEPLPAPIAATDSADEDRFELAMIMGFWIGVGVAGLFGAARAGVRFVLALLIGAGFIYLVTRGVVAAGVGSLIASFVAGLFGGGGGGGHYIGGRRGGSGGFGGPFIGGGGGFGGGGFGGGGGWSGGGGRSGGGGASGSW